MITKINSTSLVCPLAIVVLVIPQLLDWLSSLSASAAEGGAINNESNYSSQINIPAGPTSIPADAAGVSRILMLRHNTTISSLSENFSGQPNASFGLAKGRTRHHKDSLNPSIRVVKT